ncbi:pyridoxal phosphate-dependent transferase [Rhexocercosporidium sp. MPI-PUGE-AT-0058]|nr:pyridoxal phosphate-dependent transferase [Rhexocercosporidium sp. MPI-PUGE-AT-0058]
MTLTRNPPFGHPMREAHFQFAPTYKPLNHGSFGTHPAPVRAAHYTLQSQAIARPDVFISFDTFPLLAKSRSQIAPLLGVSPSEVVFVPNATTGVNTVLRNIKFGENDVVVAFSTIYPACEKTVASIAEILPVGIEKVELVYPVEDEEIARRFRECIERVRGEGKKVRVAMFDTVLTFPGARFPWEMCVEVCKEMGVLSLVDGAHGIGLIDLTHLGEVSPDFFVSNCHKWLYNPRACAVLHVPTRNQHLIRTSLPTSHGYQYLNAPPEDTGGRSSFTYLFEFVATMDYTPYLCIPAALEFREKVCGGEEAIREYCYAIVSEGGECVAKVLGTSVMTTKSGTMRKCAFANVELPFTFKDGKEGVADEKKIELDVRQAEKIGAWIKVTAAREFDTYLQTAVHGGKLWVRFSGQIYLELSDFEWVAPRLKELCERVRKGDVSELAKARAVETDQVIVES